MVRIHDFEKANFARPPLEGEQLQYDFLNNKETG